VRQRLVELNGEWPAEQAVEAGAAVACLAGVILAGMAGRKWLVLPALAAGGLLLHSAAGWSLPLPLLRGFGFRTRREIDHERYALKALRGDFENLPAAAPVCDRAPVSRALHAAER
jgi:hypothetical protein